MGTTSLSLTATISTVSVVVVAVNFTSHEAVTVGQDVFWRVRKPQLLVTVGAVAAATAVTATETAEAVILSTAEAAKATIADVLESEPIIVEPALVIITVVVEAGVLEPVVLGSETDLLLGEVVESTSLESNVVEPSAISAATAAVTTTETTTATA